MQTIDFFGMLFAEFILLKLEEMGLFSKKIKSTQSVSSGSPLINIFLSCLEQLNCKYKEENSDNNNEKNYSFSYQGKTFDVCYHVPVNVVSIFYSSFYVTSIDNLNVVRHMVNYFNGSYLFHKFIYGISNKDNAVFLTMNIELYYCSLNLLSDALDSFFSVQHKFILEVERGIKENRGGYYRDIEYQDAMGLHEFIFSRELEINHQSIDFDYRSSFESSFTLEDYLKLSCKNVNLQGIKYNKLRILTDEDLSVFDDQNFIRKLPLHFPLIEYKKSYEYCENYLASDPLVAHEVERFSWPHQNAVMIVDFVDGDGKEHSLTINLNAEGHDDATMYYRAYSLQCPDNIGRINALSEQNNKLAQGATSILLAFDDGDVKKKLQEFDFMWKEAQDKLKSNDLSLNENEALLGSFVSSHPGFHFYWGRRCFDIGCYAQALKHFLSVFNTIKTENLTSVSEAMERTCYYIAFCYVEMGMYENAYYYVDLLRGSNNIEHLMELVNVLANAGDIRVFYYIDSYLKMIHDNFGDRENYPENVADFVSFLKRRRAYSNIEFGKLDDAEKEFKALLEDPLSKDYAINELAYIQRLKRNSDKVADDKSEQV